MTQRPHLGRLVRRALRDEEKIYIKENVCVSAKCTLYFFFFSSWGDFCDTSYTLRVLNVTLFSLFIFSSSPSYLSTEAETEWLDLASWH